MSDKANSVDLAGFTSADLTALSRRCLAVRKDVNADRRKASDRKAARRKADRVKALEAELAKLRG